MSNYPVITIDGPTASGKGTVAHQVADSLRFHYLDSGALYRLTALMAIRRGTDLHDEHALAKLAEHLPATFSGGEIMLANENVTHAIRDEEVGNMASKIAVLQTVRTALYGLQLSFRKAPGLVTDGRDMGTVIFPHAVLKIFLDAHIDERARRRSADLAGAGRQEAVADVRSQISERDARDAGRAVAPLKPATDAVVLDTTRLGISEVVDRIVAEARARGIGK